MKKVLSRLTALEDKHLQKPLIVLAEDNNGKVSKMTVQALIENGFSFIKVVSGSSLSDLDLLLSAFRESVFAEEGNDE